MFAEMLTLLSTWSWLDTAIVAVAVTAAMACALPGCFLVLRRQSLLGDALSHVTLPGIVGAYLFWSLWGPETEVATWSSELTRRLVLVGGAGLSSLIAAALVEFLERQVAIERGAALGVVYTSMFALGLVALRVWADTVHLDPSCVLYGNLELTAIDTIRLPTAFGSIDLPWALVTNALLVLINGLLVVVFLKELALATFDPQLASAQGLPVGLIHYGLMAVTAATITAAFESVGSVLVVAMLVVPAVTARLLCQRLPAMLVISLVVAAASAVIGHALAISVPGPLAAAAGFTGVTDASTAGMMAVACGGCFLAAWLFSPDQGLVTRFYRQQQLSFRIAREDVLGVLYRVEEKAALQSTSSNRNRTAGAVPLHQEDDSISRRPDGETSSAVFPGIPASQLREIVVRSEQIPAWITGWAIRWLVRQGQLEKTAAGFRLTDSGRAIGQELVRGHRLWEAFVSAQLGLPPEQVHPTASRVEHFLGPGLRAELESQLQQPAADPHGKVIPPEPESSQR